MEINYEDLINKYINNITNSSKFIHIRLNNRNIISSKTKFIQGDDLYQITIDNKTYIFDLYRKIESNITIVFVKSTDNTVLDDCAYLRYDNITKDKIILELIQSLDGWVH